jgi:UPF0271 protein
LKVLVLDTSAFIQGFDTNDHQTRLYTSPLVIDEIRDEMAKIRVVNWSRTDKLVIKMPTDESIKHILTQSMRIGEADALSEADQSILALTYQLKQLGKAVTLVSDDYSVQNLADELGLRYTGMGTLGIQRRFHWIYYCPGCRKQYQELNEVCPFCGTKVRRKPIKKIKRQGGE